MATEGTNSCRNVAACVVTAKVARIAKQYWTWASINGYRIVVGGIVNSRAGFRGLTPPQSFTTVLRASLQGLWPWGLGLGSQPAGQGHSSVCT